MLIGPFPIGRRGAMSPPVNTELPVISGVPTVGKILSVSNGVWGNKPSSFSYQWKSNGDPITGATSNTLLLLQDQLSTTISCVVTATNSGGPTSAESEGTSAVAAVTLPSIVEPGAEASGGWTLTNFTRNNAFPSHSGSYYWMTNQTTVGAGLMTQDLDFSSLADLIDSGTFKLTLSLWLGRQSTGTVRAKPVFEFFDEDMVSLGTDELASYTAYAQNTVYTQISRQVTVPVGARTIRIGGRGYSSVSGTYTKLDDFSISTP